MKGEEGYSLLESIVGIQIMLLLIGLIIPMHYKMDVVLEKKKQDAALAIVQNEASILRSNQILQGTLQLRNVTYDWVWEGNNICISYQEKEEMKTACRQY